MHTAAASMQQTRSSSLRQSKAK